MKDNLLGVLFAFSIVNLHGINRSTGDFFRNDVKFAFATFVINQLYDATGFLASINACQGVLGTRLLLIHL